jgi:hypothetical protein
MIENLPDDLSASFIDAGPGLNQILFCINITVLINDHITDQIY